MTFSPATLPLILSYFFPHQSWTKLFLPPRLPVLRTLPTCSRIPLTMNLTIMRSIFQPFYLHIFILTLGFILNFQIAPKFQHGLLTLSLQDNLWDFRPGNSRKTKPILLPTSLLSSLFSAGLIRRGFSGVQPTHSHPLPDTSDTLPHWLLHGKITIKLPSSPCFKRGYILRNNESIIFGEGLKKSTITNTHPIDVPTLLELLQSGDILKGHNHRLTDDSTQSTSPRLRPVDAVLQNTSSMVKLTDTDLRKGFGFRNTITLANTRHSFTAKTFSFTTSDSPDIIDISEIATIDKSKRTTTPLTPLHSFGYIVHCDILYGSNTSLKGYRYALCLINKATRLTFVYGLKTLTDVLPTFKAFCADIGTVPKELQTDFDKKLMGQQM